MQFSLHNDKYYQRIYIYWLLTRPLANRGFVNAWYDAKHYLVFYHTSLKCNTQTIHSYNNIYVMKIIAMTNTIRY